MDLHKPLLTWFQSNFGGVFMVLLCPQGMAYFTQIDAAPQTTNIYTRWVCIRKHDPPRTFCEIFELDRAFLLVVVLRALGFAVEYISVVHQ